MPRLPLSTYQIKAVTICQEFGKVPGIILQIPVHGRNKPTACLSKPRIKGCRLAMVPVQSNDTNGRGMGCQLIQDPAAPVRAAIIDKYNFKRGRPGFRPAFKNFKELIGQGLYIIPFVLDGDDNGYPGNSGGCHGKTSKELRLRHRGPVNPGEILEPEAHFTESRKMESNIPIPGNSPVLIVRG